MNAWIFFGPNNVYDLAEHLALRASVNNLEFCAHQKRLRACSEEHVRWLETTTHYQISLKSRKSGETRP